MRACLGLIGLMVAGAACAAETEHFSIVANDEIVGRLDAAVQGAVTTIDYAVDDNGRGPKYRERIEVNRQFVPVHWTIDGTSLMGGNVHETMDWRAQRQEWLSQADRGSIETPAAKLYVANDASPLSAFLYARALMHAPGASLDVLPSGRLHLEKLRDVEIGGERLIAYALSGVDLNPEFLVLDAKGRLFALLGGSVLVRAGSEARYRDLVALGELLSLARMAVLQQRAAHHFDAPVRIRNVHVFNPETLARGNLESVVFYRGRLTTVAPDSPGRSSADEVVIDGRGGTILAGLHDMHSHNSIWTGAFYLASGVTSVRDMGNNNAVLLDLMKRIAAGELPGPRIIPSGFIEGRSPYSARNGFIPETLEEGLNDVHWYADRGYFQIKIYNSMNPDWVKPLAAEAKALGLRTVGHIPAFTTPDRMIEDGYNEVTHVNQLMLGWLLEPKEDTRTPLRLTAMARAKDLDLSSPRVRHTIDLMKSHQVGLDTTAVILERLMMSRAGQVQEGDAPYLDHMPVGYQRYRKRSFVAFKSEDDTRAYAQSFDKIIETLALLHKEGIPLWVGTDDGTGFTVLRELELYAKAGIPPAEVLRMATLDCDRHLLRDQDFGSIERGKQADFILVDGDPTRDISEIRRIAMVVKDGIVYYPAEIYQSLNILPFVPPPPIEAMPAAAPRDHASAGALAPPMQGFGEEIDP